MKVLLIRPPILQLCSNNSYYGVFLPIGLAYIAAVLRDNGREVSVIDAVGEALQRFEEISTSAGKALRQGLSPDEIVARIPEDVGVIGITHMFLHEWPTIREICGKIKDRYPSMTVILGGENATAFWRRIFEETNAVDYCILGEGEDAIVKLIEDIEQGKTVFPRPGVVVYKEGKSQAAELSKRIVDLKRLSWPAWEFFAVDRYLMTPDTFGVNRGPAMPVFATRGCPYECTFCSNVSMWTQRYIARDPADVVAEIKFYFERYGVRNIDFCDLTAVVLKDWIMEFCGLLIQESFAVTWQLPAGTRSEALDFEVLAKMYAAGCRNITYAPESGSKRLLKIFRKKINLPVMINSLRAAGKVGLVTRVNIIIGHPQEHIADMWRSFSLLIHCAWIGCDDSSVMMFSPYPGSEDTLNLVNQGKLVYNDSYYYSALARSGASSKTYNARINTRSLILMQYFLILVFYGIAYVTRPWRIFFLIRSLITGIENTQAEQLFGSKLRKINR